MLQQILNDMFIDPDLLAELDDQQKQTLFCKMRAEQVRRWQKREEQLELEESKRPESKRSAKVQFLMGKDDQPWTWVVGADEQEETASVRSRLEKFEINEIQFETREMKFETQEMKFGTQEMKFETKEMKSAENAAVKSSNPNPNPNPNLNPNVKAKPPVPPKDKVLETLRQKDIYEKIRETQRNADRLSELIMKEQEEMWKERERKAKEAERRIREIARQAREEHLKTSNGLTSTASVRQKRSVAFAFSNRNNKRRANKPSDRTAVEEWFRKHEVLVKGSAVESDTGQPSPWFHGFISRTQAEQLLENYVPGTFLVRLSERIWGYAISLRSPDRCKHFLVDAAGSSYQFFGAGHLAHSSLSDLILYHKISPITSTGQELLVYPCPRDANVSSVHQLFA